MIAHWMLYATAVSLLLGAAAFAAERFVRLYDVQGRWAWVLATVGSLALPVLSLLRTQAASASSGGTVELLSGTASVAGGVTPAASGGSWLPTMLHAAAVDAAAMLDAARAAAAHLDTVLSPLDPALLALWALMSAAFLAYVGASWWRLSRVLKRSRRQRVDGHDVLISTNIGPAVVGLWRQRIVVPAWVLEEADGGRRMILAHEREHLAAGDPRLLAFSFLALALMPWNAALWWQTRCLRLALELDCDARVLRDTTDRHGYGALLLDVVERGGRKTFMAAFAEPLTLLERRIRALSDSPPHARGRRALLALFGVVMLVGAACATPHPGGATPASFAGPETAESTRPTPFSFVVTSTLRGISAVCSQGCSWKTLTARWPDGRYTITDSGVGPLRRGETGASDGAGYLAVDDSVGHDGAYVIGDSAVWATVRRAEPSASAGRFSVVLTSRDGQVSATCARGCLWKTVSGTTPTGRYRITETGIDPLR